MAATYPSPPEQVEPVSPPPSPASGEAQPSRRRSRLTTASGERQRADAQVVSDRVRRGAAEPTPTAFRVNPARSGAADPAAANAPEAPWARRSRAHPASPARIRRSRSAGNNGERSEHLAFPRPNGARRSRASEGETRTAN